MVTRRKFQQRYDRSGKIQNPKSSKQYIFNNKIELIARIRNNFLKCIHQEVQNIKKIKCDLLKQQK
jgi:hypothetical protein